VAEHVEELDWLIVERAAAIAAVEFERSAGVLDAVSIEERRFHEDVILDAALQQAREELSLEPAA